MTYDHQLVLYVDGVAVGRSGSGGGPIYYTAGGVAIARDGDLNSANFVGSLDDVRFYDRALTPIEVARLSRQVLEEGSFESHSPWAQLSSTPECSDQIADWRAAWGQDTSSDGCISFWAGGFCGGTTNAAITNSARIAVAVPNGETQLEFSYLALRLDNPDPALDDVAYVKLNGAEEWTLDISTAANNTGLDFVPVVVDVSGYQGSIVVIEAGVDAGPGPGVANVLLDGFRFPNTPALSRSIFGDDFECGDRSDW